MKPFLLSAQSLCLLSLLISGSWKRYKVLTLLLPFAMLATYSFRTSDEWLRAWYAYLVIPVAILRFAGTLEVSYRQTHEFRYWARLTGACFLLAMFYSLSVWASSTGEYLETWVQLRRYPQLWAAAFFLVLELFWLCSGCWRGSREDWAAVAFAGMCINHGAVSLAGQLTRWPGLSWWRTAGWSWGVEAVGWLALAVVMWAVPDWRKMLRMADGFRAEPDEGLGPDY